MSQTFARFFDLGFQSAPLQATLYVGTGEEARREGGVQTPSKSARAAQFSGYAAIGLISVSALVARLLRSPDEPQKSVEPLWAVPFPVLQFVGVILVGACVLGVLATLLHFLRRRRNRLYWHLACWALVVIGIVVRQMVVKDSPAMTLGALLVSAVVGVAILPGLMRWLNRITRRPGLQHVAVPFSLGFFVDLAQLLTSHYIVHLPWIPV